MYEFINWFLNLNWYWYLLVILVSICIGILTTKYKSFCRIVYQFVLKAEKEITGSKKGKERFDYVVSIIISYIPLSLRWLLTKERIANIIEWAVIKMKESLEKNQM